MNTQVKTILLTVLTLSVFVIALVELSGVSTMALFNKYNIDLNDHKHHKHAAANKNNRQDQDKLQETVKKLPKTTMEFDMLKHNFGTITEGEKVRHAYTFTNTGSNPLVISNAVAGCGCTVPSYPKNPIAPGKKGEIVVEFNSAGRKGHQQKNVLIYSNAQAESISIGFEADVKEKK
jgi:hypothetical protein